MTEKIFFDSKGLQLEGLIDRQSIIKAAIITHPHPLYGGDMRNDVVESVTKVFYQKNYTTLRFNFRGTGRSQGTYDHGNGETTDIISAISYLKDNGFSEITLAGYSFGSWINALAAQKYNLSQEMIMVSPPVGFLDYTPVSTLPGLKWVVTGDMDHFAPLHLVKETVQTWNPDAHLEIIRNADHFYGSRLIQMEAKLETYLSQRMAS